MDSKAGEFIQLMIAETGGTAPWGGFNTMLAANILREAAAMTTQIQGEIIPSNKPGTLSMGVRQAAGVCVGIAPWNAPVILGTRAVGHGDRLRQHRHPQGVRSLPGHACTDRPGAGRGGHPDGVINVITNAPKDAAAVVEALNCRA